MVAISWMVRITMALVAGGLAMAGADVAAAQGAAGTSTGKFLKAVRDEDGTTVTNMLNAPGSNVIDTREVGSGVTALEVVIERQDATWLGFLLGKGRANPNLANSRGDPPILQAVEANFAEGVSLLLTARANVNAANRGGETALIRAVQRRNVPLVRLLMQRGADPDRRDVMVGRSARDYARAETRVPALLRTIEETKPAAKRPAQGPQL